MNQTARKRSALAKPKMIDTSGSVRDGDAVGENVGVTPSEHVGDIGVKKHCSFPNRCPLNMVAFVQRWKLSSVHYIKQHTVHSPQNVNHQTQLNVDSHHIFHHRIQCALYHRIQPD